MGLIKTAMLSGAAIYGVKQISKEAERRHSQQSVPRSQPQCQLQGPAPRDRQQANSNYQSLDGNYEQAPPPPYGRMIASQPAYYEDANFQGGGYHQQQPQRQYMYEEQYDQVSAAAFPSRQQAGPHRYGCVPPEYYGSRQQQQQRRSGFVEPYEIEERQQSSSSSAGSRDALLSHAMNFAQTQGAGMIRGKNGKGVSAQEFISGFLEK